MRSAYAQVEDETLALWALVGNLEAFDELVRRFRSAVTLVALQELGSRELAEDVAQDSFLLAFRALPQLKDLSRFPAWLCAITRHRARRVRVGNGRCKPMEDRELDRLVLSHSPALAAHPVDELLRRCDDVTIASAVDSLPTDFLAVVHLRYFEEWPVARIADFLSLPVTTVKWRLHQGRKLLERRLANQLKVEG